MQLTWTEVRTRANEFVVEWRGETRERAEAQSFWNDFFSVFGIQRRRVAVFEQQANRVSTGGRGSIDCFWPKHIAVEHKSEGLDLDDALAQLLDYMTNLSDLEVPKLLVTSDFAEFLVVDLDTDDRYRFTLDELPDHLELFGFLAGYRRRRFVDEEAVNIEAAELLGQLFDLLDDAGYGGHPLRLFLVRLLFLLFADDAGVFERGIFAEYVATKTDEDGGNVGGQLVRLFQVLDTPETDRPNNLPDYLSVFPYIDGSLFEERIPLPEFDSAMRERLIRCCAFDWADISPAIFGSMFQSVMERDARHQIGAHYTTEQSIMKVIGPLFLDELEGHLAEANTVRRLRNFQERLSSIRMLDPACGCGNFLIVAYRELRRLETAALKRMRDLGADELRQLSIAPEGLSRVTVDQFAGIEYEEFPARIAEVAMYLVDHLENRDLGLEFGIYLSRFPITSSAHIRIGNALRIDWNDVLASDRCSYVIGNPPFVAKKARNAEQRDDMLTVFQGRPRTGELDYVAAWYEVAAAYMAGTGIRCAFVSTNSITQGEQVPPLWAGLLDRGIQIQFAHRTFAWSSEARNPAVVHVVVVGFAYEVRNPRHIFDYETPRSDPRVIEVQNITPYLSDGPSVIVRPRRSPLADVPLIQFGNMPNDGGHLILSEDEKDQLVSDSPAVARFVRRLVGAADMLGTRPNRWCLWLVDAEPSDITRSPHVRERVRGVESHRRDSPRAATRVLADAPSRFGEIRQPEGEYLCLPRHPSERRQFITAARFSPDAIAHDSTLTIEGADDYIFGVVSSSMFITWTRMVGGRIKSDLRLSAEMVYNTFPFPDPTPTQRTRVSEAMHAVLAAREAHGSSTLADLYDPLAMPDALVLSHRELDQAVDAVFGLRRERTELERQRILIGRYQELLDLLGV